MVMCAIFKLCKFLVKKLEVVKKLMWFKVRKKDQWDWYYLGRHNGFCSLGLTVLIPQKLRVYDQFNASYT